MELVKWIELGDIQTKEYRGRTWLPLLANRDLLPKANSDLMDTGKTTSPLNQYWSSSVTEKSVPS